MSNDKQIEEMAKDVWKASCAGNNLKCNTCEYSGLLNNEYSCLDFVMAKGLYNAGYRKQEWISVGERLPEDVYKDRKIITVLVCTKSGRVSTSSRVRMMKVNKEKMDYEYTDIFEWSGLLRKKVTHWMPLPEAPKMKGGAE